MKDSDRDEVEKIKAFYDNVYYKNTTTDIVPTRHHRNLIRKLEITASSEVLDVACGTGAFLAACQEKGADIAGVDLSKVAIEVCRANFPGGTFHACSADHWSISWTRWSRSRKWSGLVNPAQNSCFWFRIRTS